MKSRGGVEEGEVYTNRKTVTIIAADPVVTPTLTSIQQGDRAAGNGFVNDSSKPDVDWNGKNARVVLIRDGVEYPLTFAFSAAS